MSRRLELRAEHLVPKHRALAEVTTRMHVVRVMVATARDGSGDLVGAALEKRHIFVTYFSRRMRW